MQIVGQHDKSQRNHPEAENGQEPQNTAQDQQTADRHSCKARSWKRNTYGSKNEMAARVVDAKSLGARFSSGIMCFSHPQEMGLYKTNTSGCHFFEKTAWQIGQAFVLGHSHRGER